MKAATTPWRTGAAPDSNKMVGLVANLDQVVGQRLNGLGGVSSLDTLAVVANEDGLRRLNREDTGAALFSDTYMIS